MQQRQRSLSSAIQSHAERNPFRRAISITTQRGDFDVIEELDMDTLRKQERVIRAFTESVESDLSPPPELPDSLNIDNYDFGMKESSTADTIIDVAKLTAEQEKLDRTKGETQKYRMVVPGPEHVDQEIELHKSLLKNAEPDEESVEEIPAVIPKRPSSVSTADSQALRRQYSSSAVQRPRPTTPTSWCAIDAYVQAEEERGGKRHSDTGTKITVSIPNKEISKTVQKERRNSMSWSDFYESMEQSVYKHPESNVDFDTQWDNARTFNTWNQQDPKMTDQSDRRASQVSESSKHSEAQKETEELSSPVKPVRVAPPPPPSVKQFTAPEEAPLESEFGDPSQFYQGYGGEAYGATEYDPSSYSEQPYDYSNYQYDQTQYDPNAYAGYTSTGYDQYYQGYSEYNTNQGYSYDPNTGEYAYNYDQTGYETAYDPSAYNAGYDQYGLQTTVVGADDSDNSASVSPRPETGEESQENIVDSEIPSTANYDYSQYDYSAYPTDYNASVTVNEPDVFDTSAYGSEFQSDYSAYGTEVEPSAIQPSIAPILPQQVARTPDPFAWEAQERNYEEMGSALPPPRPPPIAKTPEIEKASENEMSEPEYVKEEAKVEPPSRPAPPSAMKQPPRPSAPPASNKMPPVPPPPTKTSKPVEEEEDPWARFKQMSEQVSNMVKSTEQQLKNLSETTAAKDVKDESYIGQIGGSQTTELTSAQKQILKMQEEQKKAKADKKARKSASSKKNIVPAFDPKKEEDIERAAAELVARMAASRAHDLEGWKPPTEIAEKLAEVQKESPESPPVEEPKIEETVEEERRESIKSEKSVKEEVSREGWAGFDTKFSTLPTSESDFFSANVKADDVGDAFGDKTTENSHADPFAPTISAFDTDPFDTRPIDEIVEEAKKRAEVEGSLHPDDNNLLHGSPATTRKSTSHGSTPTEGGSPVSARPEGFEDDFKADYSHTPTPLYDEDDSQPLEEFAPKFSGDGWDLMIRHPIKKKTFMSERCWKPCFVRLGEGDNMLRVFNSKDEDRPILEILLQGSYSLSENTLQAYDVYGKIHTIKLQHVLYKERVGIRAGQISRLVEGHITKYGLPLEHAAQINVLAKFACLNIEHFQSFISAIEDILFHCQIKRDTTPYYKQDEVQIHCYDEYTAHVDKLGNVSKQRARVRMFCLSFLSGSPFLEIGLNDRRREGKEIVRRKDILPLYTERWIRFEGLEFHNTIDKPTWDEDQVIKLQPPDSCFFEVMRFRIRPPQNREKPLTVKSIMKIAGSKVEIRIDVMAAAQQQLAKGTVESTRTIPCEDIQIRFPIPDAWIYIFREERTWGVGSVHSKTRRPGKVKNLKDRLMGAVQGTENTLIEVAIGEAKYEHVYRALVWRIPRLPEKHHQAYKSHLLKCRFQLSSFDLMPEEFLPSANVEFTMPLATISNTVVRSISVEQHEDSDRVEKFVRYVAKCHYDLDIDYVQCSNLDNELDMGVELKKHQSKFNPDEIKEQHEGYKIEFDESKVRDESVHPEQPTWDDHPRGENPQTTFDFEAYARQGNGGTYPTTTGQRRDSSSEEEEDTGKFPMIQIDMSSYGY